jgi:hypothetical protein
MELEIKNVFCKHCNTTKPESDFYYYRPKKCKACCCSVVNHKPIDPEAKKANNKKYYLKHKSRIIEHNTKYYYDRKAQYLARQHIAQQPPTESITSTL